MQIIKTLINFFLAAMAVGTTIVGASPIDAGTQEPKATKLMPRAPTNCGPTGPDSCHLSIFTAGPAPGALRIVGLWDYQCKPLHNDPTRVEESGVTVISSDLGWPLTLELFPALNNVLQPRGKFFYRGITTELDLGARDDCNDDLPGTECMHIAFPCNIW